MTISDTKTTSLARKLLIRISTPILAAGMLVAFLAFIFASREIAEVYDAQLVHSAKMLLMLTEHEIVENGHKGIDLGTENPDLKHSYEHKMAFRIWYRGELVAQSKSAEKFGDFMAPLGFSNQRLNDRPWRFFVFEAPVKKLRIETSERYAIRYELIGQLIISLTVPAALFLPIIMLLIWSGVKKSLEPLTNLSREVDERRPDDLTPIPPGGVPSEALPLIQALNRLFERTSDSFRREREFTDHAAHELRTPLAAMKTQAQVLIKKSDHLPELQEGLENLNATIDRASHLVEQLLSFARLQNETPLLADMNLSECMRDVVDDLAPAARAKNQTLAVNIPEEVQIKGHTDSIAVMLRNILDNAVKYTPAGGTISVTLSNNGRLEIRDTGPGLSDEDKQRAFGRFVRMDKTGQTGSGLGLSMVRWIADLHGASLHLEDNRPQGLTMIVQWKEKT